MTEETLSDKRKNCYHNYSIAEHSYPEEDVKEKIQNAQRRLKNIKFLTEGDRQKMIMKIDKIFKEEFGKDLT